MKTALLTESGLPLLATNQGLADVKQKFATANASNQFTPQLQVSAAKIATQMDVQSLDTDTVIEAIAEDLLTWLKGWEAARTPKTTVGKIIKALFGWL